MVLVCNWSICGGRLATCAHAKQRQFQLFAELQPQQIQRVDAEQTKGKAAERRSPG